MEKSIQLLTFLNFAVSNTAYGKSGEMFIFVLLLEVLCLSISTTNRSDMCQNFMDITKAINLTVLQDKFL